MRDILSSVVWHEVSMEHPTDELHTTHEGVFHIGDMKIKCYQLSDGQRVLDADDVNAMFGDPNIEIYAQSIAQSAALNGDAK